MEPVDDQEIYHGDLAASSTRYPGRVLRVVVQTVTWVEASPMIASPVIVTPSQARRPNWNSSSIPLVQHQVPGRTASGMHLNILSFGFDLI
jgi:hypothetical protein